MRGWEKGQGSWQRTSDGVSFIDRMGGQGRAWVGMDIPEFSSFLTLLCGSKIFVRVYFRL